MQDFHNLVFIKGLKLIPSPHFGIQCMPIFDCEIYNQTRIIKYVVFSVKYILFFKEIKLFRIYCCINNDNNVYKPERVVLVVDVLISVNKKFLLGDRINEYFNLLVNHTVVIAARAIPVSNKPIRQPMRQYLHDGVEELPMSFL